MMFLAARCPHSLRRRCLRAPSSAGLSTIAEKSGLACLLSKGERATKTYVSTFEAATGVSASDVWVHHAVEKGVMGRYPGRFEWSEIHSAENLRGIPRTINSQLHLSSIRIAWNKFYTTHPQATREQILQQASEIDRVFGFLFKPEVC